MTFESTEFKETLNSKGIGSLPSDTLISNLKNTLSILKYANYFSIILDHEHDILLTVMMKVNGHIKSVGVQEDKWQGENHLKFFIIQDAHRWEEIIDIPILDDIETLKRIDGLISTRLLR